MARAQARCRPAVRWNQKLSVPRRRVQSAVTGSQTTSAGERPEHCLIQYAISRTGHDITADRSENAIAGRRQQVTIPPEYVAVADAHAIGERTDTHLRELRIHPRSDFAITDHRTNRRMRSPRFRVRDGAVIVTGRGHGFGGRIATPVSTTMRKPSRS